MRITFVAAFAAAICLASLLSSTAAQATLTYDLTVTSAGWGVGQHHVRYPVGQQHVWSFGVLLSHQLGAGVTPGL